MAVCRKVLDISYAKDPRLADWLKQSKQHLVVLTEYFAIEALNAGTIMVLQKISSSYATTLTKCWLPRR